MGPSVTNRRHARLAAAATAALVLVATLVGTVAGGSFSSWAAPQKVDTIAGNHADINSPSVDGCPIQSPDGKSLYFASNRPRYVGDPRTDLDIWVAHRASPSAPFGAPVNLGDAINSTADDFCPTPVIGKILFFVSARLGGCGAGDIYVARQRLFGGGWTTPENLGCQVNGGPNTALGEAGPSVFLGGGRLHLYFSSGPDIVDSTMQSNGSFGPAVPVAALNTTSNDLRPNVRADGLEIVFDSDRTGGAGGFDIYVATRSGTSDPWSAPMAVTELNTSANETRASFSLDGKTLYFGRAPGPEGMTDIYVTTRSRTHGGH